MDLVCFQDHEHHSRVRDKMHMADEQWSETATDPFEVNPIANFKQIHLCFISGV